MAKNKIVQSIINGGSLVIEPYDGQVLFCAATLLGKPVTAFFPKAVDYNERINLMFESARLSSVLPEFPGIDNGIPKELFDAVFQTDTTMKLLYRGHGAIMLMVMEPRRGHADRYDKIETTLHIKQLEMSVFDLVEYQIQQSLEKLAGNRSIIAPNSGGDNISGD